MKTLIEKLNEKKTAMQAIVEACKNEGRPLTEEEIKQFDDLEAECKSLQATIDRMQAADNAEIAAMPVVTEMSQEETEVKDFAAYIRQSVSRLPIQANITRSDNGDVIPTTIANKIIDRVKEISPVFNSVTKYYSKGSVYVPYVAASDDNIAAGYAAEFAEQTKTDIKFTSVKLDGFLASVNTAISKSLINNTDIALVDFVVEKMAKAVASFLEKETLIGTADKITGLRGIAEAQIITSNTANKIDVDDIIDLMAAVKSPYQANAYFIMAPATLTALRKLKDGQGVYLLNNDVTSPFGFTLLGKTVYVSDNMPAIGSGNKAIFYGDFTEALAANIHEDLEIQVLNEKYADQHAIGFTGWIEADCKIQNQQAVAAIKVK